MTNRVSIDGFLAQPAMALVGLSRSGRKFGNVAFKELKKKGYRLYPVHREAKSVDGVPCYSRFADLPERVNAALIVVPPGQALDVVREAAGAGVRRVWLQQGAESQEVLEACRDLNLDAVSGECILMFAKPKGIHWVHRWIRRVLKGSEGC